MSTHRQQGRAKKRGSPKEWRQTRQEGRKDRQLTRELIYQLRRVYHPSVGFCAQVQLVGHSLHIDQLVATQTSLCIILVNKLRGHLFQLLHICGGQNFKRGDAEWAQQKSAAPKKMWCLCEECQQPGLHRGGQIVKLSACNSSTFLSLLLTRRDFCFSFH